MQPGVLFIGGGPGVAASPDGQLDPAQVLDVGAIVELVGVAGGRVSDQEPDRPALLGRKRLAAAMVDDDALGPDGCSGTETWKSSRSACRVR